MAEIKKGEAKLNIRGILFLTLGVMAAQAVLILTGAEGHKTVMGTLMTLYFAAAAVLLAGAFRDQAGYDPIPTISSITRPFLSFPWCWPA